MNFQEEELLRIFDRAIMPDSLHGQTLPAPERATENDFQDIAVSELQNYCDGLGQKMIRMQQEINTLKRSVEQEKQTSARQINECESLRRQMEYDRQYLLQILNSRAWAVARISTTCAEFSHSTGPLSSNSKRSLTTVFFRKPQARAPQNAKPQFCSAR